MPSARQWQPPWGAGSTSNWGQTPVTGPHLLERRLAQEVLAVGYYPFTSLINRHFSAEDKERIVELLWQVAYVDATLSAHEQHVIRKVADLLHLSHASYVGAKLRAKDAAGHK